MTLSVLGFLLCAVAGAVLVLLGQRDRDRFASVGDLVDHIMTSRPASIVIVLFWWWLGWHVLVAQTVDP